MKHLIVTYNSGNYGIGDENQETQDFFSKISNKDKLVEAVLDNEKNPDYQLKFEDLSEHKNSCEVQGVFTADDGAKIAVMYKSELTKARYIS